MIDRTISTDVSITAEQFAELVALGIPARRILTEGEARFTARMIKGAPVEVWEHYKQPEQTTTPSAETKAQPEQPKQKLGIAKLFMKRARIALATLCVRTHVHFLRRKSKKRSAQMEHVIFCRGAHPSRTLAKYFSLRPLLFKTGDNSVIYFRDLETGKTWKLSEVEQKKPAAKTYPPKHPGETCHLCGAKDYACEHLPGVPF